MTEDQNKPRYATGDPVWLLAVGKTVWIPGVIERIVHVAARADAQWLYVVRLDSAQQWGSTNRADDLRSRVVKEEHE